MYCKRYFKTKPNSKINGVEIYRNKKLYKTFKNDKLLAQFYFQNRFKDQDIVFNDARFLDKPLLKQTHRTKNNLFIIIFRHTDIFWFKNEPLTNHKLENDEKMASGIRPPYFTGSCFTF